MYYPTYTWIFILNNLSLQRLESWEPEFYPGKFILILVKSPYEVLFFTTHTKQGQSTFAPRKNIVSNAIIIYFSLVPI